METASPRFPRHRHVETAPQHGAGMLHGVNLSVNIRFSVIAISELCKKPKPRELQGIIRRAQHLRAAYLAASADDDIVVEIGA